MLSALNKQFENRQIYYEFNAASLVNSPEIISELIQFQSPVEILRSPRKVCCGDSTHFKRNHENRRRLCQRNPDHIMSCPSPTVFGTSKKTARPVAAATSTRSRMPSIPDARSARNQGTEFYIHGKDGKIQNKDSHGNDPYPPKGDAPAN